MEYFFVFFSLRCFPVEFVTMRRTNRGRTETRLVARGRRSSCPATASSSSSPLPQQRRVAVCTQPYFVFCTQPYFLLFCTLHFAFFCKHPAFLFLFFLAKVSQLRIFFPPKGPRILMRIFFGIPLARFRPPLFFCFRKIARFLFCVLASGQNCEDREKSYFQN